ncbi:MAG: hypothetical protein Q9216_005840 [Gyalolechia sp. 2 TL-2023]
MSLLKTLKISHLPDDLLIHIALYENVKNTTFLQQQLLDGNTAFEYAFLDASVIAESFRRFGISPATQSLYAVKLSTAPSVDATAIEQHLSESIQGNALPFEEPEIAKLTDIPKIRKIYKLTDAGQGHNKGTGKRGKGGAERNEGAKVTENGEQGQMAKRKELEAMVLGLMALRGAT